MQAIKLPLGEWINLASVRSVEVQEEPDSFIPNINHIIIRLTFLAGKSKAYSGGKAAAILEALTETAYIDKSQISLEKLYENSRLHESAFNRNKW